MKIAVRYHTRTGNTKKLAQAIAEAVGAEALDVSVPLTEQVDILFLGSAYYAADVDSAIKQFVADNKANIGRIYSFSSSAIAGSTHRLIRKLADAHGVPLAAEEFYCRGAFAIMHRGRPNAKDLQDAAAFAKGIVNPGKEN